MKTSPKRRLDTVLVERGLASSREKAQRLILANSVRVNAQPGQKASQLIAPTDEIEVKQSEKYVSRGGQKLEHALREFHLNVTGLVAVDMGSSTGGFTDCLLQHGITKVHTVDVGRGQLASKLQHDPRIIVHDKVNARYLSPNMIGEPVDMVTIDVSFISLTLILPTAYQLLHSKGKIVALIKPQFEAGRAYVHRGGVVRSEDVKLATVERIRSFVDQRLSGIVKGVTKSPLCGPAGNEEFLMCIEKP